MKIGPASAWNSCNKEAIECCLSCKSKSGSLFCHMSISSIDVWFGFGYGLELHNNEPKRAMEAPGTLLKFFPRS